MLRLIPVLVILAVAVPSLGADTPLDPESAKNLKIQHVALQGDTVSGEVANTAKHPVRDVQVEITYVWYWKDERHPGPDSPGRTDLYTLPGDIAVGATQAFVYNPSTPLPHRTDGHFGAAAHVISFTEIVP